MSLMYLPLEAPGLDERNSVGEARHHRVGADGFALAVPAFDVDGRDPGPARGFDVAPAVADTEAARDVEPEPRGGVEQHAGFRLAAGTVVGVVVRAHHDVVEGQPLAEEVVHPVDLRA